MKLENIQKLVRKFAPKQKIWNSNINGDFDFFNVDIKTNDKGKQYLHVTSSIGFARYGEWKKFDIIIPNNSTKKYVLENIESYIAYYNTRAKVPEAYANGFAAHIKATGGHSGNPVYMD